MRTQNEYSQTQSGSQYAQQQLNQNTYSQQQGNLRNPNAAANQGTSLFGMAIYVSMVAVPVFGYIAYKNKIEADASRTYQSIPTTF